MKGLFLFSSYSIVIPAIVGLIRFKKISPSFRPFLWAVWISAFNEVLSKSLRSVNEPTAINNNIYVLIDGLLLLMFFRNFIYRNSRRIFTLLVILVLSAWVVDNLVFWKITFVSSYYRIIYSLVIVLSAITLINYLLTNSRSQIIREPLFLISTGLIIFYTIKILVEAFWLYGVSLSPQFQGNIYYIMVYVNILKNLLFTLAILWMPRKQIFTMPS